MRRRDTLVLQYDKDKEEQKSPEVVTQIARCGHKVYSLKLRKPLSKIDFHSQLNRSL